MPEPIKGQPTAITPAIESITIKAMTDNFLLLPETAAATGLIGLRDFFFDIWVLLFFRHTSTITPRALSLAAVSSLHIFVAATLPHVECFDIPHARCGQQVKGSSVEVLEIVFTNLSLSGYH